MNNDNKILDQNPVLGNQAQPSAPVGMANKETGPIPSVVPEIMPAGPEVKHNIGQESTALGVKEIQDRPDLTEGVDIRHAGPSVPVPSGPTGKVSLPMSKEEIENQLKTGQDDDSGKWLAGLIRKVIAAMRL